MITQQDWGILNILKDWIVAIGITVATLPAAAMVRALLRRIRDRRGLQFLDGVTRSISFLVYPIGLRLALDAAPLGERAEKWVESAIHLIFVFTLANLIRHLAMLVIEWSALKAPRDSDTFQHGFIPLLRKIVSLVVFLMAGIMILKYFGFDVMSLITALGVGSLAVGMASKDTLSNMISGFMLIIDRNLRQGDTVDLGGSVGVVQEIGLRSTRLNMGDGNILIVPNQELVNTKIFNLSLLGGGKAVSVKFRVSLDVPFDRMRLICSESFAQVDKAWKEKGCAVQIQSVLDGLLQGSCAFWVRHASDSDAAVTDFHSRLIERTRKENIRLEGLPR